MLQDPGQLSALQNDKIATCFSVLQEHAFRGVVPRPIFSASDFAAHNLELEPELSMSRITWMLLQTALDHAELLVAAVVREDGRRHWLVHSPWTVVRGVIESAAQVVWILWPNDAAVRKARLLLSAAEDQRQQMAATRISGASNLDGFEEENLRIKASVSALNETLPEYALADNTTFKHLMIIQRAAELSRVTTPRRLEFLWRIASGYAHGKTWALKLASDVQDLGPAMDGGRLKRSSIDPELRDELIVTATGLVQAADWIYDCRRGERRKLEMFAFGPGQ